MCETSISCHQALRSNIGELVESIEVENAKVEQLRKRVGASTGETLDRQEELLKQLNGEVIYGHYFTVYWGQVGFRVRSAGSTDKQAPIKC